MGSIKKAVAKAGASAATGAINAGAVVVDATARVAVESGLAKEVAIYGAISAIDAMDELSHRQPSEEKLRKLAKRLSKDVKALERRFAKLSREIVGLTNQYGERGALKLLKKGRIKADLQRALLLKYGFIDYVDILFSCMEDGAVMTREEIEFFNEYGSYLKQRNLTDRQVERIERVVMSRHGKEIDKLANCDTTRTFELLRDYGKKAKKTLLLRREG